MLIRTLSTYTLAIALILAVGVSENASAEINKGVQAPAWTGTDLSNNGATVDFPEVLDGKPAVVLFWATWCSYCKAFMPAVKQIQADYAAKGVQIISLNAKERGRGDPKAYVASLGFPMVAIGDADAIAEQYNVNFIPGLMVVDGDGQLTYRRRSTDLPAGKTVAEQWDGEVRAALDAIVGG
jgi:thiol-disulfide isomerase/thioredoxin